MWTRSSLAITLLLATSLVPDSHAAGQFDPVQQAVAPGRELNISWFVFRDVNRNGSYDVEDRPYAGLPIILQRPDGSTISTASNINGFANFKMSTSPEQGVIFTTGKYSMTAIVPTGWGITTTERSVEMKFHRLEESPAGIIAGNVPDPLGVAPVPSISGQVRKADRGNTRLFATGPSGESTDVAVDEHGRFRVAGGAGAWFLSRRSTVDGSKMTKDVEIQYYPVVLSKSFFDPVGSKKKGRLVIVGYDDLTRAESVYKIPNGYVGLNWRNWVSAHSLFYKGAGYVNSTVSSEYVAYNGSGHPGEIWSSEPFDFVETYIGVAWPEAGAGRVHLEAYRGEELVYEDSVRVSERIPIHFRANYLNITRLRIYSDVYWQVILEDSKFHLAR